MVDDADFEALSRWSWNASPQGKITDVYEEYRAARGTYVNGRSTTILMHRQIIGAQKGQKVDHRDGNPLNNQRANLRLATTSQNGLNQRKTLRPTTSSNKGVCFHKRSGKWRAQFRKKYIGDFKNEQDAARAYDATATAHDPEYARINGDKEAGGMR